jgi:hypothetical protein
MVPCDEVEKIVQLAEALLNSIGLSLLGDLLEAALFAVLAAVPGGVSDLMCLYICAYKVM